MIVDLQDEENLFGVECGAPSVERPGGCKGLSAGAARAVCAAGGRGDRHGGCGQPQSRRAYPAGLAEGWNGLELQPGFFPASLPSECRLFFPVGRGQHGNAWHRFEPNISVQ